MRRPLVILLPTTAVLLAAAAPMLFLRPQPRLALRVCRSPRPQRRGSRLRHAFGPGALTPTGIVVDAGRAGAARRPAVHAAVARLTDGLFHDPEVYVVASGLDQPYVSRGGRYARVLVVGRHEYGEPASQRLLARVRDDIVPARPLSREHPGLRRRRARQGRRLPGTRLCLLPVARLRRARR